MVLQVTSTEASWMVTGASAGLRIDAFLRAQLPFLSRRELEEAFRAHCFALNDRRARKGDRVAEGDRVQFTGPPAWLLPTPTANRQLALPVVHEDDHLLAVNKPAGMDCHGFSARDNDSLVNFLLARWPELSGIGASRWEPGLVHRLDRETSGIVLVAKTQSAFDDVRRQFRARAVKKRYLALVWGGTAPEGTIAFSLAHDAKDGRRMQVMDAPARRAPKLKIWPALTHYRKVCERRELSLLVLEMATGVTHQIRAHLAAIGHPIVGDALYGSADHENFGLSRHFLHANELCLSHPFSRRSIRLEAPLAPELAVLLARLKMAPERSWIMPWKQ